MRWKENALEFGDVSVFLLRVLRQFQFLIEFQSGQTIPVLVLAQRARLQRVMAIYSEKIVLVTKTTMDPSYNDKLTIAKQSRTSEERATEKDDNANELQSTRNFEDSQRNGMKNFWQ